MSDKHTKLTIAPAIAAAISFSAVMALLAGLCVAFPVMVPYTVLAVLGAAIGAIALPLILRPEVAVPTIFLSLLACFGTGFLMSLGILPTAALIVAAAAVGVSVVAGLLSGLLFCLNNDDYSFKRDLQRAHPHYKNHIEMISVAALPLVGAAAGATALPLLLSFGIISIPAVIIAWAPVVMGIAALTVGIAAAAAISFASARVCSLFDSCYKLPDQYSKLQTDTAIASLDTAPGQTTCGEDEKPEVVEIPEPGCFGSLLARLGFS